MFCLLFFFCSAPDSTESPILEETAVDGGDDQKPKPVVKYGELVILGYVFGNGCFFICFNQD